MAGSRWRRWALLWVLAMLAGSVMVAVTPLAALGAGDAGCTALGGDDTTVPGTCEVSALVAVSGTITVGEHLHLLGAAHLDASASGVTLIVDGDLTMDAGAVIEADDDNVASPNTGASNLTITVSGSLTMAAGSRISADNDIQGGTGGDITVTVAGDMWMGGTAGSGQCRSAPVQGDGLGFYNYGTFGTPDVLVDPSLGAVISSHRYGASSAAAGGHVIVTVGNYGVPPSGSLTMERCSLVDVSSRGSGGEIDITVGWGADIDGLVLSESGLSGTGANQPRGGGPIDVRAGCDLTISATGVLSSKGADPGADLVHLKGCAVYIYGVVQSTAPGAGHVLPTVPPNLCNGDPVAHPPGLADGFDGCVRIIGGTVVIDATGANNGNVNVDGIRSPMKAWIDIFATGDITILGDPVPAPKWAVSANGASTGPTSNSYGGVITIKSVGGRVVTGGQAVLKANADVSGTGSDGGILTIEAGADVALDGSYIEALGFVGTNVSNNGGIVGIRSFGGAITSGGDTSGHIDATGGVNATPGVITLTECAAADSYLGTVTPSPTENRGICGGAPTLPADAQALVDANLPIWQACREHTISGMKWYDRDGNGIKGAGEPGLDGWTIHLFNGDGSVHLTTVTSGGGNYQFEVPAGSYTICEELQAGWVQTYPAAGPICAGADPAGDNSSPGPFGIAVVLGGADSTGNDLGNRQPVTCKEDPARAPLLTRTVDTRVPLGGAGIAGSPENFHTLQAAYDAAKASPGTKAEVIGMFSKTTENVVLDTYTAQSMTITQCESAQVTAANAAAPVWRLTSTRKLLIIGPDAVGGTIGWSVEAGSHELKAIRANGASVAGVRVLSNANNVSFNNIAGRGIGLDVLGSSNVFKSGTIGPNSLGGVHFGPAARSNTLSGATIQDNGLFGVWIEGALNTVQSNKLYRNAAAGIKVSGSGNKILSNTVETSAGDGIYVSGASNLLQDNKVSRNTGDGIEIAGGTGNTLKGNASGASGENSGSEFRRLIGVVNGGGNKADGVSIPSTAKCPAFFSSAVLPSTCE